MNWKYELEELEKIRNPSLEDDPPKLGRPSAGATKGSAILRMSPAPPPPLDGLDGAPGRLPLPPELPPPKRDPIAGARTGKRAAAVEPELVAKCGNVVTEI